MKNKVLIVITCMFGVSILNEQSFAQAKSIPTVKHVAMTSGSVTAPMENHRYAMVTLFRDPYRRFEKAIVYQQVGANCEIFSIHQPESENGIGQTDILVSFKPERGNGYNYCIVDLVQDLIYSPGRKSTYQVELGTGSDE